VIHRRLDLDAGEPSLEDGDNAVDEPTQEVDEDNSKEWEDEVANKDTTSMITGEDEEVLVVADGSDGRTTTSRNATAMHQLISSPTGRCWRRSISTVWLS
jgi:hypothetical protein